MNISDRACSLLHSRQTADMVRVGVCYKNMADRAWGFPHPGNRLQNRIGGAREASVDQRVTVIRLEQKHIDRAGRNHMQAGNDLAHPQLLLHKAEILLQYILCKLRGTKTTVDRITQSIRVYVESVRDAKPLWSESLVLTRISVLAVTDLTF